MKRSHLRWLIPIVLYFIAVTVILTFYRGIIYSRAATSKLTDIALAIGEEVRNRDIIISDATSAITVSGRAMELYTMDYNDAQIRSFLKALIDETEFRDAVVCDEEGNGYNYAGKAVSIGDKEFFPYITSEYSRGGTGIVLPDRSDNSRNTECLLISGIRFANRDRGYLIGYLPIEDLADQLFRDRYIIDVLGIVTINGDILSDNSKSDPNDFSKSVSFWEQLPPGISRDTIRLSISQKNVYLGPINGYGYIIVSPMSSAGTAGIALIKEETMRFMTRDTMDSYGKGAFKLILASGLLIGLILLSYFLSDLLEKRAKEKIYEAHERDELTGLMTRESAMGEIKSYTETVDGRGLLFLLEINDVQAAREKKGDTFADEKLKEFASSLYGRFRSTDIVARFEDDKFMVFLKDIHDQKDVRKQTDEMQLFLHDTRFIDADKEITVNAGAAMYPDSGRNIIDVVTAAERALKRSKVVGKGILSF